MSFKKFLLLSTFLVILSSRIVSAECPTVDDIRNPVFLPDPTDCNRYFLCFNGAKISRSCSEGLYWDVINNRCDFSSNVTCYVSTTTQHPVTTTERIFICSDLQRCPISGFGILPHMTNCLRYFICDRGIKFLRTCPYGKIFDVRTLQCDIPADSLCARYVHCIWRYFHWIKMR